MKKSQKWVRMAFRDKKFYGTVEELQEDLDQWLHHYNYERPHRGYRNMGLRPFETRRDRETYQRAETFKEAA